jgi:tetratricopeptide (TPR) repeat protein
LAGHGYFDAEQQAQSGFVIGEDLYLTAAEIGKIEPIPELVFLNCCYGGKIPRGTPGAGSPHRMAATLSEALINMGVKAVVASGWAVDDGAAREFATKFYDAMLNRAKFGEAVLQARAAVFRTSPEVNTWGAYQCYGNPDFTLELSIDGGDAAAASTPSFVARREVLESVKSIRSRAVDVDDQIRAAVLQELSTIDRFASEKYNDGEVLSEIGHAYAALGEFNAAEDAYNKAFSNPDSSVPVEAVEQFANLLYRKAETIGDARCFDDARKYIEWTLGLSRTVERLSLMGSLYKREARFYRTTNSIEKVQTALQIAVKYYTEACNPGDPISDLLQYLGKADLIFDPYPAVNVLAIKFLLGELTGENLTAVDHVAERAAQKAREKDDFWRKAAVVDVRLIRELVTSGITERTIRDDLASRYRRAFSFGSARQRGSTISQIGFLRDMVAWMQNLQVADALSALLAAI